MHSWIQTPTLNWPKHQKRTQWHMFHWPGFVLSIHDERSQKKRLLEGFNVFLFLPSVFPYILPFEPNFRMVKPCKSPTVDGFYQHFASIHAGQSASKIRMLVDVNPFKSISIHIYIQYTYIYMCVCVIFRLETCRNTWNTTILPAFSPVSQAWGSSWATVSWRRVRWRRRTRAVWRPKWQAPWGKCDEIHAFSKGLNLVDLWLIYD